MRSDYVKPTIEFEDYAVNTALATGCNTKVHLGPGDDNHEICDDYGDAWTLGFFGSPMELNDISIGSFYPEDEENGFRASCSCYLSAGGETLFTS